MNLVPNWALSIFRKWACADFCLNCGFFVLTPSEHCQGINADHIVVRRS
jgi:hypothetical protein